MKGILIALISVAVGLYVLGAIFPDAIVSVTNSTAYTGAPAAVITLATTVVGIVAVVAVILILLRRR